VKQVNPVEQKGFGQLVFLFTDAAAPDFLSLPLQGNYMITKYTVECTEASFSSIAERNPRHFNTFHLNLKHLVISEKHSEYGGCSLSQAVL